MIVFYSLSVVALISQMFLKASLPIDLPIFLPLLFIPIVFIGIIFFAGIDLIILLPIDICFRRDIEIKERVSKRLKSLVLSQSCVFPVFLGFVIGNLFVKVNLDLANKVLMVYYTYISKILLFIVYKYITDCSWKKATIIITVYSLIVLLFQFLIRNYTSLKFIF